ncbi:HAD hydrolase-like protein [Roseibacillus persicicus]|uniref:HAD hydrolase-like protein n=1 Tax=Roseibacillus persicicus TaxID=454148 RepID=UPI00398A6A7E
MHILFDLDGTLVDSSTGIFRSLEFAFRKMGKKVPPIQELRSFIGPPLGISFQPYLPLNEPEVIEQAIAFFLERYQETGLYECEVYPGFPEILGTLRDNGHTLGVATAKSEPLAKRLIHHLGLQSYFHHIDGSKSENSPSDKAALLNRIIERETLNSTETIMVGDRKYDMAGARANDLLGIGVLWGFGSEAELNEAGAKCYIAYPHELPGAIPTL